MIFSRTLEHRQPDVVLRKTRNVFNLVAVLSANLFWHDVVQHCGFEIMLTIATTFKLAEIHLVFLKWINLYSQLYCPPICFPTSNFDYFPSSSQLIFDPLTCSTMRPFTVAWAVK